MIFRHFRVVFQRLSRQGDQGCGLALARRAQYNYGGGEGNNPGWSACLIDPWPASAPALSMGW